MSRKLVKQWLMSSPQSSHSYTVSLWDTGEITCNCPGWIFKQPGKPRGCKHTLSVKSSGVSFVPKVNHFKYGWSEKIYSAPPATPLPQPQAPTVQPRVIRGKRDIRL